MMNCLMKALAGFIGALIVSIGASVAETGDWQVVETSGIVRTSQAMAGIQPVSTGNVLGAGSVLSTGVDGHAVLVRGEQQIVVGPNSRMSLPVTQETGMTKIVQDLGTLLFKVDKKEKQHFQVETPIIAAVVKGTTFTVTAGATGHSVHVAEGAVEVSAIRGGANQMVTAGMTATISKSSPGTIQLSSGNMKAGDTESNRELKNKEAGNLVVPTEVGADQLDYATLSNGVIQPRPDAPTAARANAAMGNDVSSAVRGQGGGAAVVEQIRMNAVGDGDKPNRGVGNAFGADGNNGNGNGNGGAGVDVNVGNGNGNNGNGNGNGGVGVDVNVGNGNGNNGNGNGNGGVGVDVNVGNGNGNNGNGNGGVGVDVGVGGVEVDVGVGQGGVGLGLGLGKPKN